MSLRLKDRLGLIVGVMLYPGSGTKKNTLTYMQRDGNGTLWAYIDPNKPMVIVILNKNHTCSAAKLKAGTHASKIIGGTDSFAPYQSWKLLREHIADKKREKKEIKKRKKGSVVKRKHIKHIIADWVVEDL